MAEHPNATLYRTAMGAFMSGDESGADMVSDDIVWWQIGSPAPLRGKQAVLESMARLGGVEFDVDVHDVTASDDHVVGLVSANVRVDGREFSYRTAEIAHVVDGKITERWAFSDDTQAIIDFFSSLG
jgi:ketosteroid isomerase-like protein